MNPLELIAELEKKDFDYYLNEMLNSVPEDEDTREGSIMYDAIAPAAMAMANRNTDLINYIKQSHVVTATGDFLDYFAQDKGMSRNSATYTKVTARIIDDNKNLVTNVDIGDRFASIGADTISYSVIAKKDDGNYLLQSELIGTSPNNYLGQILPITANDSVSWAEIIEISAPARDYEDDESLRARLLSPNDYIAYGGNFNDYKRMVDGIKDVGALQVYPSWKGGGTVKLAILDNDFNPATSTLRDEVKNIIDPTSYESLGIGLAPIGHQVTIVSPELLNIKVETTIEDDGKVGREILKNQINNAVNDYFNNLKKQWSKDTNGQYSLTVYRSKILSNIMNVEHVINVSMPSLNGANEDISLTFNNDLTQLPNVSEVVINE